MTKTIEYRTSAGQWDGSLPYVLQFGRVTANGAGVVNSVECVAPCDGRIEEIIANVVTDGAAATALVNVTKNGVEIVTNYSIDAIGDGSIVDFSIAMTDDQRKVSRGDRLQVNIENTAAGAFVTAAVVMPV